MAYARVGFDKRLHRILRHHARLAHGAIYRVDTNGLIHAHPRAPRPQFSARGVLMLIGAAFLFKGYVHATLGSATYDARVAELSYGALIEQAGAWVMQADGLTLAISDVLRGLGL